jgi:cytochrome c
MMISRTCCLLPVMAALLLSACGQRDAFNQADNADPHQQELRRAFAICAGCHDTDPAQGHRVGPNLHAVIGRKAGSAPGYRYSDAMKASDIVWDAQQLDEFLQFPTHKIPGTRMVNATVDPERRRAVIEYLSTHR